MGMSMPVPLTVKTDFLEIQIWFERRAVIDGICAGVSVFRQKAKCKFNLWELEDIK